METKVTDAIPRASIQQVLRTLAFLAEGPRSFQDVRLNLLRDSLRQAPATPEALWTVARDALADLQRLALVQKGPLPRKRVDVVALGPVPCEATESGRELGRLSVEQAGEAFDQLLLRWLDVHPYFRAFQARLDRGPLHVPSITSIRDLGADRVTPALLADLPARIAANCGERLRRAGAVNASAFEEAILARARALELRADLSTMDAKRLVDAIDDLVIIPAVLAMESLPGDPVTFQHLLKVSKEFLTASSASSHPDFSGRVLFKTCTLQPLDALRQGGPVTNVLHHGRKWARERFGASLLTSWPRLTARTGGYADVYALRAIVCVDLGIQPTVFDGCLASIRDEDPTFSVYTEVPFGPPPPGEDYVLFGKHRIGRIRLSFNEAV